MIDYLSKDDDSEIEMRETEHGVAISLRMLEDGEETAGTTFYLRPEQVRGMAEWLSARCGEAVGKPTDAIPVSDIKAEIAHIHDNASRLKELAGQKHEARCRELCAVYLGEFISSWEMKKALESTPYVSQQGEQK